MRTILLTDSLLLNILSRYCSFKFPSTTLTIIFENILLVISFLPEITDAHNNVRYRFFAIIYCINAACVVKYLQTSCYHLFLSSSFLVHILIFDVLWNNYIFELESPQQQVDDYG